MGDGGIAGNDDSFVAFAFAIVSLIMMFLYFPVLIGCVREAWQAVTGSKPKRKRHDDDEEQESKPNWRILVDDFTELPRVVLRAARMPGHIMAGARLLSTHSKLARSVFVSDAAGFCFRPRFIVLVLWVFLLTSAMYASITFDPHGVLGLANTATTSEIKRAYRKLSKINHPDHNQTEHARVIYPQIKKAYKALVDPEAFEKEMEQGEMSMGIGLPNWMTNHEHDGKVLFGLLGVLLGVPYYIWRRFQGNAIDSVRESIKSITETEEMLEPLYLQVGIPLDPKYVERRRERGELAGILVSLGIVPVADPNAVDHFPSIPELKRMCMDPQRHSAALQRLGLPPALWENLKAFFESYEVQPILKLPEAAFTPVDRITYESTRYIIAKTQEKIAAQCNELVRTLESLTQMQGLELRTVQKLTKAHSDFLDNLDEAYKPSSKLLPRELRALTETPQRRAELTRDIPREIQAVFDHVQREAQMQQQMAAGQMPRGAAPAGGGRRR
jgi:translocation protein SEC63